MTIENNETVTEEDKSATIHYEYFRSDKTPEPKQSNKIKIPSLGELLDSRFRDRKYLLSPWLREHESCMVYADTGVGKSMFALSAALAVAGGGEFLWMEAGSEGRRNPMEGALRGRRDAHRRHSGTRATFIERSAEHRPSQGAGKPKVHRASTPRPGRDVSVNNRGSG
jgi:hypothetical protein